MGHRLSKQQRMLPAIAQPHTAITDASRTPITNEIAALSSPSSVSTPTSVIITIRMLKMEPNDTSANVARQPTCLCSPPATTATTTSTNDIIIPGNCAQCSPKTGRHNNNSSKIPANIHHPVIDSITDDENDDDDNSNIFIGQLSQFNNNCGLSDGEDSTSKLDNNNRDCVVATDNLNSLNLRRNPKVICDNVTQFSSDCYSTNDSAISKNFLPLVGCKTWDNLNMDLITATNYKKTINGNKTLTTCATLHNSVEPAIGTASARAAPCGHHNLNNNRSLQQEDSLSESDAARLDQIDISAVVTGDCVPHSSQRSCHPSNVPPTMLPNGSCIKAALAAVTLASSVATSSLGKPNSVVCTSYKRIDDQTQPAIDQQAAAISSTTPSSMNATVFGSASILLDPSAAAMGVTVRDVMLEIGSPLLDFSRFNPDDYPIEDCDETARIQRALEIAEGVEPPPGFMSNVATPAVASFASVPKTVVPTAAIAFERPPTMPFSAAGPAVVSNALLNANWHSFSAPLQMNIPNSQSLIDEVPRIVIHSQIDYIHCLVPDLKRITNCGFYWGKMDRYEAERLLEGKPEGTFLLRDSAQEEFLFSVSFRKYGRSLHARIEQFNHKFSFDCHDPGVFTSSTVTGLLEHYKDPACVMFFEPALTLPLNRNFCFTMQQLCRATIVSHTTYDGVASLDLPTALKSYLKEYHYKQRVRVKRYDDPIYNNS